MRIDLGPFQGVRPRVEPRYLNQNEAQIADNCRLWSGALGAWKKPLSVFPAGTNYLRWSERFDNVVWTSTGLNAPLTNVTAGPDGALVADKLREDASNGLHQTLQAVAKAAVAEPWTGAVSMAPAERTFGYVEINDGGANFARFVIDLNTGAITQQSTGGTFTGASCTVDDEENGFWRAHVTATTSNAATIRLVAGCASTGTTVSYAGVADNGIYVFGGSLRRSAVQGPYRVTEGTNRPTVPVSFYLHKNANWFLFDQLTHVAPGALGTDTADTIYFTRASGEPRFTYSPVAEDPAIRTEIPRSHYTMGLPVPPNPPVAALAPATGNITAAVGIIQSVGAQATASFNIAGVTTDGSTVKALCKFGVTLTYNNVVTGRLILSVSRGGIVIGQAELPIVFQGQPPFAAIAIDYTLEVDDTPPAGTYTYAFAATILADGGGAIGGAYNHTSAHVRYTKTRITSAAHGRAADSLVTIRNVGGMEAINDEDITILSVVDANNFYVDIDSKGQTYTAGGTWTQDFSDEERQDTAYVVTFLSTIGGVTLEGPPSAASNIIARGSTEPVNLTGIPTAAADGGSYVLTGKRLYRTNVRDDLGANYQFVAEIALATVNYTDSLSPFDLGEVLTSTDWIKPPADMRGLINVSAEVLAGFSGKDVCFSDIGAPHAWPLRFRLSAVDPVVALASFGNGTGVLTNGRPSIIYGTVPGEMRMEHAQSARPCVSATSAADMGYAVVYASNNGLARLPASGNDLITRDIFTEEEWKAFNPASIIGAPYDDRYVGFYTKLDGTRGGFVFDPQDPLAAWVPLNFGADAVWTDPKTGDFYVLIDEYIARWNAHGTDYYANKWRSKRFDVGGASVSMSGARIQSSAYPVTFTLYGNTDPDAPEMMVPIYTTAVANGRPFRLPPTRAQLFDVEMETTGGAKVKRVSVATSMDELVERGA